MIRRTLSLVRRFTRREDGNMTIEFVIIVPALFSLFLASVEMGVYSMRQMFLDRGLDMTVRTIRLNTGIDADGDGVVDLDHGAVKQMICANSGFLSSGTIDNCAATMRLEMVQRDPRAFVALDPVADCVDISEEIDPPRGFVNGAEHQLMMMRACVKFDPVFPTTGIGLNFIKDGAGKAALVSTSAFVQEPI
jgi:Flp pilus assembly protein TadG